MTYVRRNLRLAAVSCVSLVLFACSSSDTPKTSGRPSAKVTALRGKVTSAAGEALAQVKVSAGSVSATTDPSGRYELRAAAGKTRVRFALAGFVDGLRSPTLLSGNPTQLDVALLPLAEPVPLDATAGGMAEGARGSAVRVPAGAFVDASGNAVSGMVNVYLTPLDPSSAKERAAAPEFVAESDGDTKLLESFGMLDIQVRKADQRLDVASGKQLEISIPVPSDAKPEATIDLWSFDEAKASWVNEGTATYDAASNTYVGMAKHMSLWNADQVASATCVCGVVEESGGAPLAGARIEAAGASYFGSSSAHTDASGKFCVAVRKDSDIDLAAYHASSGGQTKRIQSGSEDTAVPPRANDTACADVGTWRIKKDEFVSSDGKVTKCGDVENPFAGGCAASLGEAFGTCFKPEGECTFKLNGTATTTKYANGSYTEGTTTGSKFYSSSGKLCATVSYDLSSTDDIRFEYTIPGKGTFKLSVGAAGTGDFVVECPDGKQTRVTAAQREALQACASPEASADQANECTIEGGPELDGGVSIPTTCTKNADCSGGSVCCDVQDGVKFCFDDATCKLIKQQQ